eukprot:TRINITY_DN571_c0_g1_i1.p1 TRINITY_DN571_c0_g1~~TRINITY_DN571_c0_g1_i1.p1  ORF type:complete len:377 (+),score=124.76 TRINITY_DN571_c0_g1_i1:494-1624(+)
MEQLTFAPASPMDSPPLSPEMSPQEEAERKIFMADINKFMSEVGKPLSKIPIMGYKELDLFQLFREVSAYGGFNEVVKNVGTWSKIWKRLGNFDPSITDSSFRLKKNYERYLLDYEFKCFPENRKQSSESEKSSPKLSSSLLSSSSPSINSSASKVDARLKIRKKGITNVSEISRRPDGSVELPFTIGDLTVESLGSIVPQAPFITEKQIWPVGFVSSRSIPSKKNPEEKIKYTCTIENNAGSPQFTITCSDESPKVVSHSASSAWRIIAKRSLAKGEKPTSVSGAQRCGLTHPIVSQLIRELPGADVAVSLQDSLVDDSERKKKRKHASGSSSSGSEDETWVPTKFGKMDEFHEDVDLESAIMTLTSLKYCAVNF